MLKIWIAGSAGQIGTAINEVLDPLEMEVFNTDKDELDITQTDEVLSFGEINRPGQYVKSLTIDCDYDTLLAKVDQVGAACHTGNPTCFFQHLAGTEYNEANPLEVFEIIYNTVVDRKENPKEGSYTNYLFDKGIDKILKKNRRRGNGDCDRCQESKCRRDEV